MTVRYIDNADQYKKIFGWFYNNAESIDFSKSYYLEFEDADRRRSKLQNAFLWGWVYKELSSALNAAGYSLNGAPYTPAIIHAIAQANFRITDTFTKKVRSATSTDLQRTWERKNSQKTSKKSITILSSCIR